MGDPATARADRELAARCDPIELLIVDVDGVLTDGVIAIDAGAWRSKHFHVRDGLGYALWHRAGKRSAILSGRRAAAVERRAAELSIAHVLQGHDAKAGPFRDLVGRLGLEPRQVCYVGDDLPDLPVLRAVGLAACPADAVAEVRERRPPRHPRRREAAAPSARSSRSSSSRRGSGTAWSNAVAVNPRPRSAVRTRAAGSTSLPLPSPSTRRHNGTPSRVQEAPQGRDDVHPAARVLLRLRPRLRATWSSQFKSERPDDNLVVPDPHLQVEAVCPGAGPAGRSAPTTGPSPTTCRTPTTTPNAGSGCSPSRSRRSRKRTASTTTASG